ncbi:TIR domain-containing protein [Aquincola sp. S2]|uniref:TIR domain-containing protein n=1 Tax=Pseudaquabacterium terrae TaxID=2732868 RepID=A0ABX2ERG2_9BURK|nr:TIR domain-containing protein [Aquabacterium terrae]NRF71223.1 TIR domain-containing protein [Aquabacterium terrae]
MPQLRNYDIFISHAWRYGDAYYRLVDLLDAAPYFQYRNYSAPEHDPLADPNTTVGQRKLEAMINAQVRPVQCVLVIAGMYAAHRFWIDKEIAYANYYSKPIIGVIPWGQQRVPQSVQFSSHEMVHWNTDSIVSAIRRQAL